MKKCLDINMAVCFWCREDYGVTIGEDLVDCDRTSTSPKHMFVDYQPCENCKKDWDKGDVLIEAQDEPVFKNQPEITEGAYPTGNHWVVKKGLIDQHILLISKEDAEDIGLYNAASQEKENET